MSTFTSFQGWAANKKLTPHEFKEGSDVNLYEVHHLIDRYRDGKTLQMFMLAEHDPLVYHTVETAVTVETIVSVILTAQDVGAFILNGWVPFATRETQPRLSNLCFSKDVQAWYNVSVGKLLRAAEARALRSNTRFAFCHLV